MISLEAIADSPCFISLPHFWGNEIWGGLEAREVYFNTKDDRRLHSFYVDIEPISGQAVREARRFQFNFRIERNMQFPQIFLKINAVSCFSLILIYYNFMTFY